MVGLEAPRDASNARGDGDCAAFVALGAIDVLARVGLIREFVHATGDIVGDGATVENAVKIGRLAVMVHTTMFQLDETGALRTLRHSWTIESFKAVNRAPYVKRILGRHAKGRCHLSSCRVVGRVVVPIDIPVRAIIAIVHGLVLVTKACSIAESGIRIGGICPICLLSPDHA